METTIETAGDFHGASSEVLPAEAGAERRRPPRWVSQLLMYVPATALPVGALGVAALLGRGPRALRGHRKISGLLAAGAAITLARWQLGRWFTEQPDYEIESRLRGLEVRRYGKRVVAETVVDGTDWDTGRAEGFHRLAGYIFGGNDGARKVPMTAPVETRSGKRFKIAMTAPVTAQSDPSGFTVTFAMPKAFDLASLPTPTDGRVRLREIPSQRVAVLRYRGTYSGRRTERMQRLLLRRVREAGLTPAGAPSFAGYDAPATMPFLRRVEAWVPIV
jgi:hypothetical protein